jgi:hypothetical protein
MNSKVPRISGTAALSSGPPAMKRHSSQAIGISEARITPPTIPIGMSRSSRGSAEPLVARRRDAAIADRMPARIGPMILSNVQIAATPITPAPRKRTSERNTVFATSSAVPGAPAVRIGSTIHQPSTSPANIAAPTEMPTRCPAPISAKDRLPEMPVAPAPTLKKAAASSANSRVLDTKVKPAATSELNTISRSPFSASAPPSRLPAPTLSTSAAATPSGYGSGVSTTRARRNGTENITPNMPPTAVTAAVVRYGKPCHQPTITRPGRTKMIAASVPAADATVCTMLFSRMVEEANQRSTAIEITAAGIDVANVRPTLRPR